MNDSMLYVLCVLLAATNINVCALHKEQRNHIEDIAEKHLRTSYRDCCDFLHCDVYKNDDDNMELNLRCRDCYASLCIDIPFDMMAEIVDYLREQNSK